MVIISVGICNKNGQLMLSRQFDHIKRTPTEDLYLSFPKLISSSQQHTYVQSDQHTFLYIPIDPLYLVLISTRNSNIIEDQDTLRLVYKLLVAICSEGTTPESVESNRIDIILGIDDIISMGYRESVSMQEVFDQLKMESADEKTHLALLKQQEEDAKEAAKKAFDKLQKK